MGHSEETKRKIGEANKGKVRSPELRLQWSTSHKGQKAWNKGKTGIYSNETLQKISNSCRGKKKRGHPLSEEHKHKLRELSLGRKFNFEQRRKVSEGIRNSHYKPTEEHRKNLSKSKYGERSYQWKGGISSINKRIRNGIEFRLWREAIFARDNWTCQQCGQRGKYLHPHHIKYFADYPELRFAIDNGITLCKNCHLRNHLHKKQTPIRAEELAKIIEGKEVL